MAESVGSLQQTLAGLDPADSQYAMRFVERLLESARGAGATDLHIQPAESGLEIRWRLDGVLQSVGTFPAKVAPNVVARLKVLAELLTYRTDVPQEGRIRDSQRTGEMRVSTFPTLFGEKVVVRIFADARKFLRIDELGLPAEIATTLSNTLRETSGAILITGPAGCGKTTTAYACLRELVSVTGGTRSLATLEDPIEMVVPGVAQSQVHAAGEMDLAKGLKFLLRQDPEVILVGEIRDRPTAEVAFQAALTGHLVLSTFHAGSACAAISRLGDMQIPHYLLRSGLLAIVSQRLVRRLCDCAVPTENPDEFLGLPVSQAWKPVGCDRCAQTGYSGRTVIAELLMVEKGDLGRAVFSRSDASRLEQSAIEAGMVSRWERAVRAVGDGVTSPTEVRRVMGFGEPREHGGRDPALP